MVRGCNFCGTYAGIDPASSAVVEASVLIYLSVYLVTLSLAVDSIGRSQFDDNVHFSRTLTSTVMISG